MALTKLNNQSVASVTSLPSGLITSADMPAGTVIGQHMHYNNTKTFATASAALMSTSYTPQFSNSKLLITMQVAVGTGNINGSTGIRRNGSFLSTPSIVSTYVGPVQGLNSGEDSQGANQDYTIITTIYQVEDSPNTTSAVTYDWYWALNNGNNGEYPFNRQKTDNGGSAVSSISILEIKQ